MPTDLLGPPGWCSGCWPHDGEVAGGAVAAAAPVAARLERDRPQGGAASAMIVKMILDRAPPADVVGGHAALRIAMDQLLDAWEALANDKRANAERLYYGGLFEELRTECSQLWGTSSELYHRVDRLLRELSNPKHEILPA